jgi:hypothetical protein
MKKQSGARHQHSCDDHPDLLQVPVADATTPAFHEPSHCNPDPGDQEE